MSRLRMSYIKWQEVGDFCKNIVSLREQMSNDVVAWEGPVILETKNFLKPPADNSLKNSKANI